MDDACERDRAQECEFELRQESEIDDPSIGILPETDTGPVEAGPPVVTGLLTPCDISFLQQNFKPLINVSKLAYDAAGFAAAAVAVAGYDAATAAAFSSVNAVAKKARDDAAAEGRVPTETEQRDREGFVESDEVSSNVSESITKSKGDFNPVSFSFKIMGYIESQIKTDLLHRFSLVFDTLYKGLSVCVPDLPGDGATKGFVGINKCGFLSKYTTVIYYAGKIPYNYRTAIETLIGQCNDEVKPVIERWNISDSGISFTCKVEKSPIQYDTQKIILCIKLPTGNVIQIPILNVVGFPVFQDVTPLLQQLGCVGAGHQQLPIFFTPQLSYDFIRSYPGRFTEFIASQPHDLSIAYAFITGYPTQFTEFIGLRPDARSIAFDFIIRHTTQFTQFIGSHPEEAKIIAYAFIAAYPYVFTQFIASNPQAQGVASVFMTAHPAQFAEIIAQNPQAQGVASAFIAANPLAFTQFIALQPHGLSIASAFIAENPPAFTQFIALQPQGLSIASDFMRRYPEDFTQFITSQPHSLSIASAFIAANPQDFTQFIASQPHASCKLQSLSLLDIIVRVRLCANQGAITALSEPSKEEVTLILSCFQGLMPQNAISALMSGNMDASALAATAIAAFINTITQAIYNILYSDPRFDRNANIKPFALLCNIFYNFINVSLGFRSLAKIIYSDFFGTSDNYGKVIRACQDVNRLPIMNEHVKFFLTGSNAARVYLALNDIIKLGATISPDTIAPILSKTFGNLSDNDFMIYLKNAESEQYRVFIRMILGGSFYFFKDLFDPVTLARFTKMMIQSVGIVGYMDHLFAQRFDATAVFLRRCYEKDPTSFLAIILQVMEGSIIGSVAEYFKYLDDKQINVAHLDGVFKHYTLKKFYEEVFEIFQVIPADNVYDFLINHATSINCIATVWTLVLNVLYTLFVPENCLARIVVGKFDNDPKNLKLYMEILNDHLTELQSLQPKSYGSTTHVGVDLMKLRILQTSIAGMCEAVINRGPDVLNVFKQTCSNWVLTMVTAVSQHVGPSEFKGLFMLSESDAPRIGGRYPTNLERALCLAYYPTQQGNICSAASNRSVIFLHTLRHIFTTGPIVMDITQSTDSTHEVALRDRLTTIGERIYVCLEASDAYGIEIKPEGTILQLSTYLNFMWKHLTKTAIHLKIFFKENLSVIQRVTGIKYIALVLGGYFQIRLLVDDVSDQCPDAGKRRELVSFKISQEMLHCKRGLLPLLREPLLALINEIIQKDRQTGTDYGDPISQILKILGFLFSIKVKSTSPHSPYHLLRLEDSMLRFRIDFEAERPKIPFTTEILKPTKVMFIEFLTALGVPKALIKCICSSKYSTKLLVKDLDLTTFTQLNPGGLFLYDAVGGSNNSESNSGRKSVSSLNKHNHKYKHNKLARNNRTHRNKNKRKKNSKSKSHKPKPNSKSKSKSKSKSHKSKSGKSRRKNVTFKRRKRSNRY
jgi:hypothetical protein